MFSKPKLLYKFVFIIGNKTYTTWRTNLNFDENFGEPKIAYYLTGQEGISKLGNYQTPGNTQIYYFS